MFFIVLKILDRDLLTLGIEILFGGWTLAAIDIAFEFHPLSRLHYITALCNWISATPLSAQSFCTIIDDLESLTFSLRA